MNNQELLPIGTVVLLRSAVKKLMIIGVRQQDVQTGTEFDYLGVLYPEGFAGNGSMLLFDHEAIESVHFRGCDDEERREFLAGLGETGT